MEIVNLNRFEKGKKSSLGYIQFKGEKFYTLELVWLCNQQDISCITDGYYPCKFKDNEDRIEIKNVSGRSGVQIHVGNWIREIKGCILIGCGIKFRDGEDVLINSKKAFLRLKELLNGKEFILEIKSL